MTESAEHSETDPTKDPEVRSSGIGNDVDTKRMNRSGSRRLTFPELEELALRWCRYRVRAQELGGTGIPNQVYGVLGMLGELVRMVQDDVCPLTGEHRTFKHMKELALVRRERLGKGEAAVRAFLKRTPNPNDVAVAERDGDSVFFRLTWDWLELLLSCAEDAEKSEAHQQLVSDILRFFLGNEYGHYPDFFAAERRWSAGPFDESEARIGVDWLVRRCKSATNIGFGVFASGGPQFPHTSEGAVSYFGQKILELAENGYHSIFVYPHSESRGETAASRSAEEFISLARSAPAIARNRIHALPVPITARVRIDEANSGPEYWAGDFLSLIVQFTFVCVWEEDTPSSSQDETDHLLNRIKHMTENPDNEYHRGDLYVVHTYSAEKDVGLPYARLATQDETTRFCNWLGAMLCDKELSGI